MEKAPRHMGIELLRIVATGMIVLHHLLAHGGLLAVFPSPGPTDAAMRLLNAFAYCAVNLYGLISGYGSSGRFRPARLIGLWVQAWFTGVVLTALLSPLTPVTAADWRTALLPIGSQEYWYLTAYFGLYVLSPALRAAVERLSRRQLTLTLLGCAVLFTLTPSAAESLSLSGGYHAGWLCVLYLLGMVRPPVPTGSRCCASFSAWGSRADGRSPRCCSRPGVLRRLWTAINCCTTTAR